MMEVPAAISGPQTTVGVNAAPVTTGAPSSLNTDKSLDLKLPVTKMKKADRRSAIDRVTSKPRHWSVSEDESLRAAVMELGEKKWKLIARRVPTRNHTQCFQRWNKVLCPGLRKGKWCKAEDELLIKLAKEQLAAVKDNINPKKLNWGLICKQITGRTAKQCRERWVNNLNPEINKGNWTREEDKIVLDLNAQYPNKWALIAKQLAGRTENAVKIRYHTLERTMWENKHGVKRGPGRKRKRPDTVKKSAASLLLPKEKEKKLSPESQVQTQNGVLLNPNMAVNNTKSMSAPVNFLTAPNVNLSGGMKLENPNAQAQVTPQQEAFIRAQLAQAQNQLLLQNVALQQLKGNQLAALNPMFALQGFQNFQSPVMIAPNPGSQNLNFATGMNMDNQKPNLNLPNGMNNMNTPGLQQMQQLLLQQAALQQNMFNPSK